MRLDLVLYNLLHKGLRYEAHPVVLAVPMKNAEAAGWDLQRQRRDRWAMQTIGVSGQ